MSEYFKRIGGIPYVGNILKACIDAAFHATTGHKHSGAANDGGDLQMDNVQFAAYDPANPTDIEQCLIDILAAAKASGIMEAD